MIMVTFILVCIYLFYRRNDKGNKIFRKYDNKKINKWYYILPLFFVIQASLSSLIILLC